MKQSKLSLLLALILAVGLLVGGCGGGSDSYNDHTTQSATKTATPLIEAETLKSWMDAGLVNAGYMQDNVVILNVGAATDDVIPGAYKWVYQDEVRTTRLEGLAPAGSMVQTGDVIDSVLQRSGVNDLSTIVLTANNSSLNRATVTYFTLRYWGFPKERIKILNGFNGAWDDKIASIDTANARINTTPADIQGNPYNFSVRNNETLNDQLRYSIAEVIQAVDANLEGQAASTGNVVNIIPNGNRFRALNTSLDVQTAPTGEFAHPQYLNADSTFKTAAEIEAVLSSYTEFGGFNPNLPTVTHCGSGLSCTPIFFALDAILGLDIAVWDGSTGQWADYGELNQANENDFTGTPPVPAWTTPPAWDVNAIVAGQSRSLTTQTRSDSDPALDTELINQFLRIQDISDPAFNQIEEEDKDYIEGGAEDGAPEAGADVEGGC